MIDVKGRKEKVSHVKGRKEKKKQAISTTRIINRGTQFHPPLYPLYHPAPTQLVQPILAFIAKKLRLFSVNHKNRWKHSCL